MQVPEDLPTVFRVLKVKDMPHAHVIRNMLLDWTSAERLLLVDVRLLPPLSCMYLHGITKASVHAEVEKAI